MVVVLRSKIMKMILERNKLKMKQLGLPTLHGYQVMVLNAEEVTPAVLLNERDYICKQALIKGYPFIVYYQSKKDPFDCGVYVAPLVTYKNLLNSFLRPDDEYYVFNSDNQLWEMKNYTKEQFSVKEPMTLDNFRWFWKD